MTIIIIVILLLLAVLISNALFLYLQKRGSNALNGSAPKIKRDSGLDERTDEFLKMDKEKWIIDSKFNGNKLVAWFTKNKNSKVTVILVHGFAVDHTSLDIHAQLFNHLGYNVLQIDNQASGQSAGKYMGYGYIESRDLLDWISEVNRRTDDKIVLFGASMGAATVMLTSGESLPDNVLAVIEDSGYTSAEDILSYHCKDRFHIRGLWLIKGASVISRIRAGFFYGQADCTKALEKCQLPVLFMHGKNDFTVPFEMEKKLSTCGNFDRMIYSSNGVHIRSYYIDSVKYQETVENFLSHYL
ncbi:alpha/beta hydrolase [Companilactobacillus allii]|uniref:Alpha/beta hydrolase n=1 Tax=Companilactobacillus allii TaxID=1847728 RepID=A0A1P8Q150_9LACO|nr:alpha/beta hydrolase [Companilactobacillus allii]APX71603.1 alpha/beta hydrolase [Companilactobacillus allii]USQ68685.1 alpha/beta hydrolase [Companilactobacillus allii]